MTIPAHNLSFREFFSEKYRLYQPEEPVGEFRLVDRAQNRIVMSSKLRTRVKFSFKCSIWSGEVSS
jgi:hypothetical protein